MKSTMRVEGTINLGLQLRGNGENRTVARTFDRSMPYPTLPEIATVITESKTFQPIEHSISAARDFAREILIRGGHRHEDALLVVSELATNAVRHARTAFTVTVRDDGSGIEIGVSDNSRFLPVTRTTGGQTEGFGLVIIDRISGDWGIEQSSDGKRVWVWLEYRGARGT